MSYMWSIHDYIFHVIYGCWDICVVGKILEKKNYTKEMVGYLTVDCGEDGVRHKL